MGWLADRYGVRWTVMFGAVMIAARPCDLVVRRRHVLGQTWALYVGHGLFMGLLGNAGLNAPLYVYVSRWFDRRRGSALALIASGQYISGALWPPIFEQLDRGLWLARHHADVRAVPGAGDPADRARCSLEASARSRRRRRSPRRRRRAKPTVLGWPPNLVFAHAGARGVLLLHADVDAAGASGRAVQRSRHQADAWRRDAVACCSAPRSSAARCGAGSPTASAG